MGSKVMEVGTSCDLVRGKFGGQKEVGKRSGRDTLRSTKRRVRRRGGEDLGVEGIAQTLMWVRLNFTEVTIPFCAGCEWQRVSQAKPRVPGESDCGGGRRDLQRRRGLWQTLLLEVLTTPLQSTKVGRGRKEWTRGRGEG